MAKLLLDCGEDANRQQGGSARGKEVVPDSYRIDAEHVFKDLCELEF